MKRLILPILSLLIFLPNVDARFWTNKDGKTFEGELVEVKDNAITIRRTRDRIKFTVNAADLSQGDQDYLKGLEEDKKNEEVKEEKEKLKDTFPKSKRDLEKWVIGTEWAAIQSGKKGQVIETNMRRFDRDGVQSKKRLKAQQYNPFTKYTILSSNTLQYGMHKYTIKFDSKYLTYEGTGNGGRTVKGKRIID